MEELLVTLKMLNIEFNNMDNSINNKKAILIDLFHLDEYDVLSIIELLELYHNKLDWEYVYGLYCSPLTRDKKKYGSGVTDILVNFK